MNLQPVLFWILAIIALVTAIGVVVSKNPVHSVLALIGTFFSISGLYVTLNAQFLAIVNIIVYAGAIMVLFLFVLMLMNLNSAEGEPRKRNYARFAAVISGGLLFLILVGVIHKTSAGTMTTDTSNIGLVEELGRTLFHHFVLPFEISSFLFLSAMIGAVVIGKKDK